jgi:hypothetical protein
MKQAIILWCFILYFVQNSVYKINRLQNKENTEGFIKLNPKEKGRKILHLTTFYYMID